MTSIDLLKKNLTDRGIKFEEYINCGSGTYRWKWLIRFDNTDVYYLKSSRFLLIVQDDGKLLVDYTMNIRSKHDLIRYLEEKVWTKKATQY